MKKPLCLSPENLLCGEREREKSFTILMTSCRQEEEEAWLNNDLIFWTRFFTMPFLCEAPDIFVDETFGCG